MAIQTVEDFFAVVEKCGPESLYAAAKAVARTRKNYLNGGFVNIDKTSPTMMAALLGKTAETPTEKLAEMREKREQAGYDFCWLYGGYVAYKLDNFLNGRNMRDIPEREEFIAHAAYLVTAALIRSLERHGYRQGTFSHLVHKSLNTKALDMLDSYVRELKKDPSVSWDEVANIAGGVIEIDDPALLVPGPDEVKEEECDKMDAAAIMDLIVNNAMGVDKNSHEMFVLNQIKGIKQTDIAEEFDVSVPTVNRRVNEVAKAAHDYYKELKAEAKAEWR